MVDIALYIGTVIIGLLLTLMFWSVVVLGALALAWLLIVTTGLTIGIVYGLTRPWLKRRFHRFHIKSQWYPRDAEREHRYCFDCGTFESRAVARRSFRSSVNAFLAFYKDRCDAIASATMVVIGSLVVLGVVVDSMRLAGIAIFIICPLFLVLSLVASLRVSQEPRRQ